MEIPRRVRISLLFAFVASSVACSSHEQLPQQIGDCTGPAHSCIVGGVGSGSGTGSSVDGGGCGVVKFVEPCETCVENSCCSLVGLCSNNPDCLSLVGCIGACTTQACANDCRTNQPSGTGDLDALDQCRASNCGVECGFSDAATSTGQPDASTGLGCGRLVYPSATCETCVEGGCCDQAEMCSSDPDCSIYIQCIALCASTDTKCITDCQTLSPMGFTGATHLEQCVQDKCATQCQ